MIDWKPEWEAKLLEYRHPRAYDSSDVRVAGAASFDMVARRLNDWFGVDIFTKDAVQKRYAKLTPPPSLSDFPPATPTPYWSQHFDGEGKLLRPAPPKLDLAAYMGDLEASGRCYKTLVLSDTQGCFCDEGLLDRVLDENPSADVVVLPGDVVDWYEASRYVKDRDYPLLYESDWYVRLLSVLAARYPGSPVVITDSNHRRRVSNAVRQLPSGLLFLVEANPERYLAQPFANVHALDAWWVQFGDVIYCHAEGPTALAGSNSGAAIDAFKGKLFDGKEGVRQFRAVLAGHSHKAYWGMQGSVLGIEPGCLARLPMSYTTGASALKTTQENAYAVIVQQGGRIDVNKSRLVILGR